MSKKHFSILLAITVVVGLAVVLLPSRTSREASVKPGVYLPELAAAINDVEQVRITSDGGEEVVTLVRGAEGWVVQESYEYPADWSALRPLLASLSQAQVVEAKTDNPEYYHRLGVEDVDQPDAQGTLVSFPGSADLPGVIIGNAAQGREGQYMRRQDAAQSVLVDQAIRLPVSSAGWLNRSVVDLPQDEVLSVAVEHADGEQVRISRVSTEVNDFTLEGLPEGRKTRSAYSINQLASVFDGLDLESVLPADEVSWENASEVRMVSESGLQLNGYLVEDGEHRWIRLEAVAQAPEVIATEEAPVDQEAEETEGAEATANEINQRVQGWAYQIPLYKYDAVNKRMDDLLEPVEEE